MSDPEPKEFTSASFITETLAKLDRNAPLSIDVLAMLMQAQCEFLLSGFTLKLKERDDLIARNKQEITQLRSENTELRNELDDLQQYSRRNAIRISGIPEPANEKPQDVQKVVKKLIADDMKVDINDFDFCRMHRVGKAKPVSAQHPEGLPRQIIVKFTRYSARRKVMKARKTLKDLTDRPHRIYVNEDLTRKRAQLARLARTAKNNKKIKDTWVFDGKIFIKLQDDSVNVVTTETKLRELVPVSAED